MSKEEGRGLVGRKGEILKENQIRKKKNTYIHQTFTHACIYIYIYIYIYIRGSLNKFPDFFRVGTFIDITYMKLQSPSK